MLLNDDTDPHLIIYLNNNNSNNTQNNLVKISTVKCI